MKRLFCYLCILALISCFFTIEGLAQERKSIAVDAGHGGTDSGAVGCGLYEKTINLYVSQLLKTCLQNSGWTVYMTRSDDSTVSLSSRTNYANSLGVGRFVSVHCNAYNGTANGTETFCYPSGSSTSFNMRDSVNPKVVAALGTYNRGCKTADFHVLRETNMPAILVELAFIDNAQDASKLGNSTYRQAAAEAIKNGVNAVRGEDEDVTFDSTYIAPRFSPDGDTILVSKPRYHGLYLIPVNGGKVKALVTEASIGYKAQWIDNSQIQYTASGEENIITTDGFKSHGRECREALNVTAINGEIWVEQGSEKHQLTLGGDTYFNPILSPNKRMVVYEGLRTGLHVSDIYGQKYSALGLGNNPCWSSDSQKIFFDVAQDNGHQITVSNIYMVSLNDQKHRVALTKNTNMIYQRPSISPDGTLIAFDSQGKIMVARLGEETIENPTEVHVESE